MKKILNIKRVIKIFALFLAIIIYGCSDFLNSPEVTKDPNRATEVSPDLLYNSIQIKNFFWFQSGLPRTTSIWMQQLSGVDRQFLALGQYEWTENDHANEFNSIYTGGGLIDIRKLREDVKARGWKAYEGITKVWEALSIGMAASLWGDLPYSEAVSDVLQPKLDKQSAVYAELHKLLDEAIADLTNGSGIKPANDHIYGGNLTKWIEAAWSLKARLYMHWAEVNNGNYALALAAIQKGISSNANNFKTRHSETESESNPLYQFQKERDSYMRTGKHLVDLLKTNNDPRLEKYIAKDKNGQYTGAAPGQALTDASNLSTIMLSRSFSLDILSYTEALLIWAECAYKAGDNATAIEKLNAAKRSQESKWNLAANSLGVVAGLSGDALISKIMEEKYIALFFNIETYNDWKRTNKPVFVSYNNLPIPRTLYYSNTERNTNKNIPTPSQKAKRNENDPGDSY